MLREGLQVVEDVRKRFDGERRNPWDEPECGHHYARAMSAWSCVIALSGFDYHAGKKTITLMPKLKTPRFSCFWSNGLGWGTFSITAQGSQRRAELAVTEGKLPLQSIQLASFPQGTTLVLFNGQSYAHEVEHKPDRSVLTLKEPISIPAGAKLVFST
jgi:non-lysosomal glucosylceramidase